MAYDPDERKLVANVIALVTLFITVPVGYLIDIYIIYWLSKGTENIFRWPVKTQFGLVMLFFLPPLCHWLSYRYCQENFGWFSKK